MKTMWKITVALALVAGIGFANANAGILTIEDGNASVEIDTESQSGMYSWTVDGVSVLAQQWFWIRDDASTPEFSIDNLPLAGEGTNDTNAFDDPRDDNAVVGYDAGEYTVELDYTLTGGGAGSGTASIAELIRISNKTDQVIEISFFQYSDFDLNGTAGGDSVVITGGNTATQTEGVISVSESVVTPLPSEVEAGVFASTLNKLNDTSVDNLDGTTSAGPGDVTWAFQWNFTLAPQGDSGSDYLISKIKSVSVVPEPTSFMLLGLAGLAFASRRRA